MEKVKEMETLIAPKQIGNTPFGTIEYYGRIMIVLREMLIPAGKEENEIGFETEEEAIEHFNNNQWKYIGYYCIKVMEEYTTFKEENGME